MRKTFTKGERLCSRRKIDALFHGGSSFIIYPFRVVFLFRPLEQDQPFPAQVIVSVSKRRFKSAFQRNRIKRLVREVYRLQKGELLYSKLNQQGIGLDFAIQYVGKEELPFDTMYSKMKRVLSQLAHEIRS